MSSARKGQDEQVLDNACALSFRLSKSLKFLSESGFSQ